MKKPKGKKKGSKRIRAQLLVKALKSGTKNLDTRFMKVFLNE